MFQQIICSQFRFHQSRRQCNFILVINSNFGRFELGWIGLNWIELSWIGLNWVESGWIGLNWVELFLIMLNCLVENFAWGWWFWFDFFWGGGCPVPHFFLHESYIQGQIRLHPEFHLPKLSRSGLNFVRSCSVLVLLLVSVGQQSQLQPGLEFDKKKKLALIYNIHIIKKYDVITLW